VVSKPSSGYHSKEHCNWCIGPGFFPQVPGNVARTAAAASFWRLESLVKLLAQLRQLHFGDCIISAPNAIQSWENSVFEADSVLSAFPVHAF
jgi:hypothetical protein